MDPHLKDTGPYIHCALLILFLYLLILYLPILCLLILYLLILYLLILYLLILYGNLQSITLLIRSEQQIQETNY